MMNAFSVYAQLQDACRALDAAEDHAIAAYVEWAMTLMAEKYGLTPDAIHAPAETERPG